MKKLEYGWRVHLDTSDGHGPRIACRTRAPAPEVDRNPSYTRVTCRRCLREALRRAELRARCLRDRLAELDG